MKNKLGKITAWCRKGNRPVWFEYGFLALIILLPLLLPGYILTLDLVFTPHYSWPLDLTNTYPLDALLWLLYHIVPGDIVEKIVLLSILLCSGVGMHLLIQQIRRALAAPDSWRLAPYAAGIFYMINPFTYDRFMAGQWLFLLGYSLVPFFVRSFLRLAARPTMRQGTRAGIWAFVIVMISVHHIAIIGLIGIILTIAAALRYRGSPSQLKKFAVSVLISLATFLVLSSYWLVPALLGSSPVSQAAKSFDGSQFAAFATDGGSAIGRIANVIRLQGFWAESQQLFTLPQSVTPAWGVVFMLAWVVIITGAISLLRRVRFVGWFALTCIVLGVILAATPLLAWLSGFIPLLGGYREPDKFASLIALGFGLLFGFGAARIVAKIKRPAVAQLAGAGFVLLPLVVTPTMLWGFAGQLMPRHYPQEWHNMNERLQTAVRDDEQILFLPWHQYSTYSFSPRIIANPAAKFFSAPTVISDNPEFGGISPTFSHALPRQVDPLLQTPPADISARLQKLGIKYILLASGADDGKYAWLNHASGVQAIHRDKELTLYKLGADQ